MSAPREISDLVNRFAEHADAYRSGAYNETQVRREFVDPMFKALGWDMDNLSGYAEAYKDVIHEDAIKIGGATKAPDYCFRIGGTRKFFLEAKKPSVDIKSDASPAFQLRRYAWSAKLPLSILTDFEEFAVYDCRIEPTLKDKASAARVLYLGFQEYADRWDDIAKIFSREAILKGSFDKFAESNKAKRGTAQVDDAFLYEIEKWRADLARNLATRNPELSQRDLNFSVQRTIDRIVFLRICEDRRIEGYGRLQALLNGEHTYDRMRELFRLADERYNSGLFHFRKEKNRIEPPDDLTPGLEIDDDALKKIIKRLYYPYSPYEFSVLPADILGQVYEQFLGKVIRLTEGHQAKVEDKPEVKKAGGVYYTPTYIVDYIVKNTVGKLLEKKTPKQAAKLRILDPACGSGSFLIGVYQYLLDWHRDWYVAHDPKKLAAGRAPVLYQASGGEWKLTTSERKRILLQNIFGVDIDAQAVETTKLSLLLKVLEGESEQSLATQLRFFHERALPDLGSNIKCGNSLIGSDFYEQSEMLFLDEEERYRINVFDWSGKDGFPEIMKTGGFDAVIGNPPYVNAWELFANTPEVRDYLNTTPIYKTADRHWDLYVLFLERALQMARRGGRVSFIIPFSYAIQKYGIVSRRILLDDYTLESIADLRKVRVFRRVPVITIIPVIQKAPPPQMHSIRVLRPGPTATKYHPGDITFSHSTLQRTLRDEPEFMLRLDLADDVQQICRKIQARSTPAGDLLWVNYGAQMSSRTKAKFGKEHVLRDRRDSKSCQKTVSGKNLYRYSVQWAGKWVEWALAPEMYGSRERQFFETPKLMIRDITGTHRIEITADDSKLYCDHTILCALRACDVGSWREMSACAIRRAESFSLPLLQGLLASRIVSAFYYWKLTGEGVRTGGGFHTYPKTIRQLPVFDIERGTSSEKEVLGVIESRAARMLGLHKQLAAEQNDHVRTTIQRQIDATDAQIDRLVYELYELTPDEIKIVEEATGSANAQ